MDLIVNSLQNNQENEDEDYGSFFLQPASSPYNIAEKVQQANFDLFNSNSLHMDKTAKVTFREELESYEPELLTDDDVNSIESDQVIDSDQVFSENSQILEYKTCPSSNPNNVINLNIFDINEDEEEGEIILEEVLEDIDNKTDSLDEINDLCEDNNDTLCFDDDPARMLSSCASDHKITISSTNNSIRSNKNSSRKRTRKKSGINQHSYVECKSHCIERLDFDLSMSIKKLEIHEKPPANCPLLKLQSRKCCDENKTKNPTNLPCYNGHRSEYGLSSAELEKRERRKEIIKLKEQKREQLMYEYKNRKNQQNEAVFCQWLKDVAKRKINRKQKIDAAVNKTSSATTVTGSNSNKECFSPNIISFPTRGNNEKPSKQQQRPRTANEFVPKHIKRARRPHTTTPSSSTSSCVFIQVPQKLLERGINIGDLLVTNSNFHAKKMHILTVASP